MMRNYILKCVYALVLLMLYDAGSIHGEVKCIEKERQALLSFKEGINDPWDVLSTWRDDDCCKWQGIVCSNQTGHVLHLHLHGWGSHYLIGQANISMLIDLKNLEYLDLSYNDFFDSHISKHIGLFTKLRYINLSYCGFFGNIPYQIGNLSQLQYLDINHNYLDGAIPYQLKHLGQLQYLGLRGYAEFSGTIPFQSGDLPLLHTLKLGGDFVLKTKDAEWMSNLSFLKNLDFASLSIGNSYQWLQMIRKHILKLTELRLSNCNLSDNDVEFLVDIHSNYSFIPSLTILDFSYNMLTSSTFQLLSNFGSNLRELYLSHNSIDLSHLHYTNFPSLASLDLSYNNLSSSVFQGNFNFGSNLQELDLSNCNLMDTSFLMSSTSIMNSSYSLVVLHLSSNLLKSSNIFHWIFNFTASLHTLDLSGNLLEGPIPNSLDKAMNCVEYLDLSNNKLQGEIPHFFGNICTLQTLNLHMFHELYLSYNQITGVIPKSIILLSELESLTLQNNSLQGEITESHLTALSKLKYLHLSQNSLSLKFVPGWNPPFQLIDLRLASCRLGPSFPSWLYAQNNLYSLDISDAGINGSVPEWFWYKLQVVGYSLNMSHNNFVGAIPSLPLRFPLTAACIDLSSNKFEGAIPPFLLHSSSLILSKNKFSDISSMLYESNTGRNLGTLVLANNQLKGLLPDCWDSISSLLFLDLSNNNLIGKIPPSIGSLVKLEALVLRNNRFTGKLPSSLKNCTNLFLLDVSENFLSGPIPSWIGESLQQLIVLSMSGNLISRYTFNITVMWKGVKCGFKNPELRLNSIDLSSNHFTGEIPNEIVYLVGLVSLNLSRNNLSGEIPSQIGNITSLESLDLSRNHISGTIPSSLSQIDNLGVLELSNNSLYGRIPPGRHMDTFDASSFEGNHNLCGTQLNKTCPGDMPEVKPQEPTRHDDADDNSDFYEALYMSLGFGFFTGFWGLLGPLLFWRSWRIAYLRFLNQVADYIYVTVAVYVAKFHKTARGVQY
ncbi:receptor-like protein EIX2 [Arachis duranensis]|uniref:Receptor-like protein EIX2 n=1 Tax=Arachis duranensis TaxID=130453 RepID=A0A9C6TK22_ARADU|nr:receptor-like protein EIX2 [Arachis duranensis]